MAMTLSGDGTIGGLTAGGLPDNSITTNDIAANAVSEGKLASGLYACKAWVNFKGDGTVAVIASGNVSSITDVGTGQYTVNFATALVDNKYSIVGLPSINNLTTQTMMPYNAGANKSTSAVLLTVLTVGGSYADVFEVNIAVFR